MSEEEQYVIVRRRVTEQWKKTARENGAKAKAVVQSEEHRAKLKQAQQARREREKQARIEAGEVPVEKKAVGRPRKVIDTVSADTHPPKRGRGRPKKEQPTHDAN